MSNAIEFVKIIKKAAVEAVNATKPVAVMFGTVTSASPLKINIEQKMTLGASQLILSRNVTDYKTQITIDKAQTITVHNSLVAGDKVILLRQQEGQKYIVWDKVGT